MGICFITKVIGKNGVSGSGALLSHTFLSQVLPQTWSGSPVTKIQDEKLFLFIYNMKWFLIIWNTFICYTIMAQNQWKKHYFICNVQIDSYTFHLLFIKIVVSSFCGVCILSILEIITLFSFYIAVDQRRWLQLIVSRFRRRRNIQSHREVSNTHLL